MLKRTLTSLSVLLLSLLAASCGGSSTLIDDGPNANLGNDELLKRAIENMKALDSYQSLFRGGLPSDSTQMSTNLAITTTIDMRDDKGGTITIRDESGNVMGSPSLMLDVGQGIDVTMTKDGWYESYDAGKSWYKAQGDTPAGFIMVEFGWLWDVRSPDLGSDFPSTGQRIINGLKFRDGSPRLEEIDGMLTRHMVADYPSADEMMAAEIDLAGAKTAEMWVTTGITPTIRQMRVQGITNVKKNEIGRANSVAFHPDGKRLAVAHGHSQDWNVRIWSLDKPEGPPRKLPGIRTGPISSVAFSPDGKIIAAGVHGSGAPAEIYLWDAENLDANPSLLPVPDSVSAVAFRPDGKMLAAAGSGGVHVWTPPYGSAKPVTINYPEQNVVNSVAFSLDSKSLATGNLSAGVRLHNAGNLQAEPTVLPHEWVNEVAFSPDGRFLASTGGFVSDEGHTVKVWNLSASPPTPVTLPGDEVSGETVTFHPKGRFLASSGQSDIVQIWDLSLANFVGTPTPAYALQGGRAIESLAFDPTGRHLASTGSEGEVLVWDMDAVEKAGSASQAKPLALKEDEQAADTPYTLLWQWNRLNEDFGVVEPPPADTIKTFP